MVRAYLPRAMCCSGDRCGRKADRPIDKLSRVISSIRTYRKLLKSCDHGTISLRVNSSLDICSPFPCSQARPQPAYRGFTTVSSSERVMTA